MIGNKDLPVENRMEITKDIKEAHEK